jgi:capsular exopolysaccharide synthesis family protein
VFRRPSSRTAGSSSLAVQDEAFRILRSNLNVVLSDLERPTVVITSAHAGEGKTTTTANLARAMALAGQRVVIVDLDLRHPNAHDLFRCHNEFGVAEVLLDRMQARDALQYVEVGAGASHAPLGLYLLATGGPVNNPAELISTRRTARLLEALAAEADIVLVDTPPVLAVADTLVIGRMVGGAVLIMEARRTPVAAVQQAKDALIRNQTRILGVVMNKLDPRDASYGYGYGYGYGDGEDEEPSGNGGQASLRGHRSTTI